MKNHKSILIIFVLFVFLTTALFADYVVVVHVPATYKEVWVETTYKDGPWIPTTYKEVWVWDYEPYIGHYETVVDVPGHYEQVVDVA